MKASRFVVLVLALTVIPCTAIAQQLFFTDTLANEIWVANKDGSGSPALLYSSAVTSAQGPVGILVTHPTNGDIIYTGGNINDLFIAPADGSGSPAVLWDDTGHEHLGVTIDPATGTLFWTTESGLEIHSGAHDGSGVITVLFSALAHLPVGITFDASRGRLLDIGGYQRDPVGERGRQRVSGHPL